MLVSHLANRRRIAGAAAAIVATATVATACSSSGSGSSSTSPTASSVSKPGKAASLVPAQYKNATVNFVINANYAPYAYEDANGNLAGINYDLSKALAADLGVKYKITSVTFDTIIPGLQAHRYDIAVSVFNVTPERLKILDFVPYVSDPTAYLVKASGSTKIDSATDLCGLTVAAATGSEQDAALRTQSSTCTSAGKKAISIKDFDKITDATTAVLSGRVDALTAVESQLAYSAKQSGQSLELANYKGAQVPLAAGVLAGSPLGSALAQGVNDLIANGTYATILKDNGTPGLALPSTKLDTDAAK